MGRLLHRSRRCFNSFGATLLLIACALLSQSAFAASLGAARFHGLWVKDDGTLAAWGYNASGQVGDGTYLDRSFPVPTLALTGVKAAAGGLFHSLALRTDGTVWAWGGNNDGQLGDGTFLWRVLPVQVTGLTGVAGIASGNSHSVGVKTDGTVWAWGANPRGQLGDGSQVGRLSPVRVSGLTSIVAVAGGSSHSLALRADGTVWAWGDNQFGQLGDGTGTTRLSPVQVAGLTGVVAISSTYDHSLALKNDGTVWSWGDNSFGGLGDGTTTTRAVPVRVGTLTGIVQIAAGGFAGYARRGDGVVFGWGDNYYGQLGDGTTAQRTSPVTVANIASAISVVAGASHAAIMKSDGTVWSTGQNVVGQIGDGSTVQAPAPVQMSGLSSVSRLAAGERHSLALGTNGTVWGWGDNSSGEIGDGTYFSSGEPTQTSGISNVVAIAAGNGHSLALRADGTVWSWGNNDFGQLGDGTFSGRTTPGQVSGLTSVIAISAGRAHNLAVKSDGSVWAWGANAYGQIGDGSSTDRNVPTRIVSVNGPAAIAAGGYHSVVLRTDGQVATWGRNDTGQLGDGTNTHRTTPVLAVGLSGVVAISAGTWHTLALKSGGTVWAFGDNGSGALGQGTYDRSNVALQVFGVSGASSIHAGGLNSFALAPDGTLYAWGGGGLNGDGTDRDLLLPVALTFIGAVDRLSAGFDFVLAQTKSGAVMVWGSNFSQKLGIQFPVQTSHVLKTRDPLASYAGADLVVEFFNPTIKNGAGTPGIGHHFVTAFAPEQISIDNGGSGPGWTRTGRTFRAWNEQSKAPPGAVPVYRFYARVPNSHFYTASFSEYQFLRSLNPANDANVGWASEGIAFYTVLPVNAECPAGYYPVYRAYNNRFSPNPALNDGNHRLSPSYIDWARSVYFLGYADEGTAFCSPAMPDAAADLHAWYIYPGSEVQTGGQVQVLFIFTNNGPGSGNGGRVYMSLPAGVTDWAFQCFVSTGTDCPASGELDALRQGQPLANWPAGGVMAVLATGTSPQVVTGGNATLKFSAVATSGNGVPDPTRPNNAPPTSKTLVKAPQACNYVVSPTGLSLGPAAQPVQVQVLSSASCAWSVQNTIPWLNVSAVSATGNGGVVLTPQANTSASPRSGTLTVAGQQVTVKQSGVPCTFSASPPSLALSAAAQQAQVALTASAGCAWNTQSSAPWLSVSPSAGNGSGTLTLTIGTNAATASRTGAITVGGLSIPVAQAGTVEVATAAPPPPPPCSSLRLQRDGDQMPATGLSGESAVAVLADTVCAWSSQSSVPWLTVTAGGAGNGNGTIKYVVQPNNDPSLRIGTINTAGKSFTVTQQGREVSTRDTGSDSGGDSSGGGAGSGGSGGSSGGSSG